MCWSSFPQGQVGEAIILNQYRYALLFPWPVRMVVSACVVCSFLFSLSSTLGKKFLVMLPFVVWFQFFCYFWTEELEPKA
jgi:hypothetical protein